MFLLVQKVTYKKLTNKTTLVLENMNKI